MTQKEQTRLQVLNSLMADHMTTEQAATLMGVSARHTRRILAAYSKEGAAALAHGNRGRRPANATPDPLATDVVVLARTRYAGVNHTHLSELLREREGIDIGRNTLRKILTDAGVNSPRRRRPPKHRVRRQRMAREGMLIQIDGSYHRWLGEDGPQFTLLLAVDDATGCVVNALFCEYENTRSYLLLMRDLIRSYGIPLALYSDRHGVFKHTPPSETAAAPTQFSRAMGEIGVQLIFARSPQAKGRVERTAGTLQDRLVTELRLAGATTIDDANRVLNDFLPRFNERFGVPSENADTAYRVPDPGMCLDTVLCLKYRRRVGRDNTVKYRWRTLQLLPDQVSTELCRVGGGSARRAGRTTGSATRRAYRRLPGSASPSSILRSFDTRTVHTTVPSRYTNGVIRRSEDEVASMGTMLEADRLRDDADRNGAARVRRTVTPRSRKPTPLQTARWKAVQKAKRKGLSIRGIARELGIHRDTVRKYMHAKAHPCRALAQRRKYRESASMAIYSEDIFP